MAFTVRLRLPDGSDGGEFVTAQSNWGVGDELFTVNRDHYRITAIVARDDDGTFKATWEVERA